jgi:TRAP-type uncharacterized transport system substrate-binding protein
MKTSEAQKKKFHQVHAFAKQTIPANALKGISAPFHPGVEKYYRKDRHYEKVVATHIY